MKSAQLLLRTSGFLLLKEEEWLWPVDTLEKSNILLTMSKRRFWFLNILVEFLFDDNPISELFFLSGQKFKKKIFVFLGGWALDFFLTLPQRSMLGGSYRDFNFQLLDAIWFLVLPFSEKGSKMTTSVEF